MFGRFFATRRNPRSSHKEAGHLRGNSSPGSRKSASSTDLELVSSPIKIEFGLEFDESELQEFPSNTPAEEKDLGEKGLVSGDHWTAVHSDAAEKGDSLPVGVTLMPESAVSGAKSDLRMEDSTATGTTTRFQGSLKKQASYIYLANSSERVYIDSETLEAVMKLANESSNTIKRQEAIQTDLGELPSSSPQLRPYSGLSERRSELKKEELPERDVTASRLKEPDAPIQVRFGTFGGYIVGPHHPRGVFGIILTPSSLDLEEEKKRTTTKSCAETIKSFLIIVEKSHEILKHRSASESPVPTICALSVFADVIKQAGLLRIPSVSQGNEPTGAVDGGVSVSRSFPSSPAVSDDIYVEELTTSFSQHIDDLLNFALEGRFVSNLLLSHYRLVPRRETTTFDYSLTPLMRAFALYFDLTNKGVMVLIALSKMGGILPFTRALALADAFGLSSQFCCFFTYLVEKQQNRLVDPKELLLSRGENLYRLHKSARSPTISDFLSCFTPRSYDDQDHLYTVQFFTSYIEDEIRGIGSTSADEMVELVKCHFGVEEDLAFFMVQMGRTDAFDYKLN